MKIMFLQLSLRPQQCVLVQSFYSGLLRFARNDIKIQIYSTDNIKVKKADDEMNDKNYYVYILASKPNGTLYTGVTNDLVKRVWEHKNKCNPTSFTCRYNVNMLVYYEHTEDVYGAI